jgi:coenzyme F420-0:L-glutamate ligase/coenzyme F420-1:gamma-L-glutamate ligase
MKAPRLEVIGIPGIPEVHPGDDLVGLLLEACHGLDLVLRTGDVLVVTSKIVSKAEGRLVDLAAARPSALALSFARNGAHDARTVEVVLGEARRVVRMDRGILIAETRHGLVCAQAGVDASNVPGKTRVALLPEDPDRSAERLRIQIWKRRRARVGVIVSDTFGRPWREGLTNVAIGVAGLAPVHDYRGRSDPHGKRLKATIIAVADELASAAELVMGKLARIPVALVRGYSIRSAKGQAADLVRAAEKDLFR